VRITDIALSTPVVGTRPAPARRGGPDGASPVLARGAASDVSHPDAMAASALARAAGIAAANKVVAAANQQASESVRGDLLDATRVP
jgi:hypothetical protein